MLVERSNILKKIVFVLPGCPRIPVGGYVVVYEYANRLIDLGYTVTVIHPRRVIRGDPVAQGALGPLKAQIIRLYNYCNKPSIHWHNIHKDVNLLYVPEPTEKYVPDADVVFATAWQTAEYVWKLSLSKGIKFYLIQHLETQSSPEERVKATWLYPMHKVVIANWLYDAGIEIGVPEEDITHIPNGIDHKKYCLVHDIGKRPTRVAMMYSPYSFKGSSDGIKALEIAKQRYPELHALLFGTCARPRNLPNWIEYEQDPPQEFITQEVYNGSSIYLCPSWVEGWGLPPAEAMSCGCAVVSTDTGGVRDYTITGETALLSPIKYPEGLADRLIELLGNDKRRIELAQNGYNYIQEFSWERSASALATYIEEVSKGY